MSGRESARNELNPQPQGAAELKITGARLFDGREFSDGCSITVDGGRIRSVVRGAGAGAGAAGALVMPGLIDCHVHLHLIARFLGEAALQNAREPDDLIARLKLGRVGGWLMGNRLDHADWRARSARLKERLDREFPDTPARLLFSDGHSALLNEAGLQRVVAWRSAGHLTDVHLEVDAGGDLTGLATDGSLELALLRPMDRGGPALGRDRLAAAAQECASHGITAVHDLFVTVQEYLELREAEIEELRIYSYIDFEELDELLRLKEELGPGLQTEWLRVQGIKCFADGSLGSGGGLLSAPYRGGSGDCGFEVLSVAEIAELARRCLDHRLQLTVHALGDRGVANVLDAYERALNGYGRSVDHRFRIEHAEVVREEDIARCRRLSVVLSMQPWHFTDDGRWLPRRLPAALCRRVSLWKRLIDAGIPVCFGSDAPFLNLSAMDGIRSAVHRLETIVPEDRSFFTDEPLTLAEALSCYSSGAAWAVFEEERLGTIARGRPADLTIFDSEIERVLMVMVGGKITWMRDAARELLA